MLHGQAEVDGQPIIKLLLAEGAGASLLTWGAISAEVERGELTALPFKPRLRWPLTLVRRRDGMTTRPQEMIVGKIRETAKSLTREDVWPGKSLDTAYTANKEESQ